MSVEQFLLTEIKIVIIIIITKKRETDKQTWRDKIINAILLSTIFLTRHN